MSCVQCRLCLLLVVIVIVTGCSSDTPAPTASAPVAVTPAATAPAAPSLKPDVPQTPEAAVQVVLEGLKASKPVVIWDALPEPAQQTLDSLIPSSAGRIDPEVWAQTAANLKKLTTLLETKKEFVLASPMWKTGQLPKLDVVKASWDPAVKLLRVIVDSELIDQDKVKSLKTREFLEGSGAKIFAQVRALTKTMKPDPLAILDNPKVTVTRQSDTSAKVTLQGPDPKSKPIDIKLGIINGKWTNPQVSMGAGFAGVIVAGYFEPFRPYQLVEWKGGYLKDMDRLGKILDQLQATKTSDEFQAIVGAQALPFFLQKVGQLRAKRGPLTETQSLSFERKAGIVMVAVKGIHTFDEPTYRDLTKSLRAISPSEFRGPHEADGATLFFVGPVDSTFDAVLKAIQVGKIVGKDKVRDTVTVELPTSAKEESTADAAAKGK
jgi:hypothetical protein